ncbi:gas vesicle protein GvpN [Alkalicoccus daliensis]|uniref:Gas vesicle protein GvpN n=1 Tax=Alkalicoccus daliensis TaxID=745820 RepID=A0A1H0DU06_9BACI|nr:gas vesicle protein GvpN [Alkalicoccus daliensis]SDN73558.1 gas vesicle protein GvpN [Alkalicoccus daliensis]
MSPQKQVSSRRRATKRDTAVKSAPQKSMGTKQKTVKSTEKSNTQAKDNSKKENAEPKKQYVETDETNSLIERAVRVLSTGYPVHLTGKSGAGKTALAMEIAKRRERPVSVITGNHEMSNEDLLGGITGLTSTKLVDNFISTVYKKEVNIKEDWTPGRLVEAAEKGHTLIYDEFSRSRPETNNLFLSILEERVIPLYGTKQKQSQVQVHPEFNIIFTSNPIEYAGIFEKQDALMDRLITMEVAFTQKTTEAIIQHTADIRHKDARYIWSILKKLESEVGDAKELLSIRSALMIATISKKAEIEIDKENNDFVQVCQDVLSGEVIRFEGADTFQRASHLVRSAVKDAD